MAEIKNVAQSEQIAELELSDRHIQEAPQRVDTTGEAVSKHENISTNPYPTGARLGFIITSIAAAVFLTALDETIIATAIPRITDEFNSLPDVGWYGSAYFLTLCAFQLIYGKLFTLFSNKAIFIGALVIFELGSTVCAAAPTSVAFIIGRAIAGLGSAGINAGYIIILAASVPLERRPIFVSSYSVMYGLATVTAPIIGGAFTSRLTWRWCFWINLPLGATTLLIICFLYKPREAIDKSTTPFWKRWGMLDWSGTCLMLVSISCLLLSLQWGGTKYAWSNWRSVLLLVIFVVLAVSFMALQLIRKEAATVPPRIICTRSVASSFWFVFTAGAAMNIMEYFLPIYFQAIKGDTALQSGLRILPMLVSVIVFSLVAGLGVNRYGYYTPFMLVGSVLIAVATGLITTWNPHTVSAVWASYQVILGMGAGLGIQQAHTAAQTVLADKDVPTGAVVLIFAQIFGGTIFISVAENIFESRLVRNLQQVVPGLDPKAILSAGATSLRTVVQAKDLVSVTAAYSQAISQTFYAAVGLAVLSFVGAACTEWKSVRNKERDSSIAEP